MVSALHVNTVEWADQCINRILQRTGTAETKKTEAERQKWCEERNKNFLRFLVPFWDCFL